MKPNRPPRIALGAIFTESNHLGGKPTDLAAFQRTELRRGSELLDCCSSYTGGMFDVLRERAATVVPLLLATACPGGPITAAYYRDLKDELLRRLKDSFPVDGVLLPLHGSAAAEDVDDIEGDLLAEFRRIVGAQCVIVATLDLHAHVTGAMVQNADALVACETYPHRDTFETGQRGARLLFDMFDGKLKPAMAMAKVPVLTSAVHGSTDGNDPFADLMRFTKSHEGKDGVASTSLFLVHPYLDADGMGSGGLVITHGDSDRAQSIATRIATRYWERRFDLEPTTWRPAEAIARGLKIEGGPVLLVETADACGGGAAGDSVATLKALLESKSNEVALVPVVDPEAAARCHKVGLHARVKVQLGHKLDPRWGNPISVEGTVVKLTDGRFRYEGGPWGGQLAEMGPSAVLRVGTIDILISTHGTYDWKDEQFRSVGLDPQRAKFIVVKNPMNYRQAYGEIAKEVFILDTPGPTPPTLRGVKHAKLQRPYYPADKEIADGGVSVLRR